MNLEANVVTKLTNDLDNYLHVCIACHPDENNLGVSRRFLNLMSNTMHWLPHWLTDTEYIIIHVHVYPGVKLKELYKSVAFSVINVHLCNVLQSINQFFVYESMKQVD